MTARPSLAVHGSSLTAWAAAAAGAEAAGFAAVWSSELERSPFVPLAAAAATTSTVALGTAVALGFVRSPLATALEALDLDELCGGRLILGVGSGVRRLVEQWHGAAFEHPARRLRETVEAVRTLIARATCGEPIEAGGDLVHASIRGWRRSVPPVRTSIPILIAAVGPLMTRTAGLVGDGWIAHELGSVEHLRRQILPQLQRGWAESGRSRDQVTVVASACCVPLSDAAEARRLAAHQVAFYASVRTYQPFFAVHGFESEALACQERFRAGDWTGAVDAVSEAMVETLTLAGTPDSVRRRLRDYDGLADMVKLGPPTHAGDPQQADAVQRAILEVCAA